MNRVIANILTLACLFLPAFSVSAAAPPDVKIGMRFDKMDADDDGNVTYEEFMEARKAELERTFTTMDADKNGVLSREEMTAARKSVRDKVKKYRERRQ